MHPMLNIANKAAREAGRAMLAYFDGINAMETEKKGHADWVSNADRHIEAIVVEHLKKAYPKHGIISEEGTKVAAQSDYRWIIDPIDGTNNFVRKLPHFALSIALEHQGEIEVALVYDPVREERFSAVKGKGALLNQHRIRVNNTRKIEDALIGTGFPFRHPEKLNAFLEKFTRIFPDISGMRRAGSAALDLAYVAAGRLDGFWEEDLKAWDIAAGALIVQEAGGVVSDFKGQPNFLSNGRIVAGNLKIHTYLLKQLA